MAKRHYALLPLHSSSVLGLLQVLFLMLLLPSVLLLLLLQLQIRLVLLPV
jgi:hypothetical protein